MTFSSAVKDVKHDRMKSLQAELLKTTQNKYKTYVTFLYPLAETVDIYSTEH